MIKLYYNSKIDRYFMKTPKDKTLSCIYKNIYKNNGMRKGSFADKYSNMIISEILNDSIDLDYTYRKYYFDEYNTFEEYLYKKELIDSDFIQLLSLEENTSLWLLDIRSNYELLSYDENNNLLDILNKMFEGSDNED